MPHRFRRAALALLLPASVTVAGLSGAGAAGAAPQTSAASPVYSTEQLALAPLGTHNVHEIAASQTLTTPTKNNEQLTFGPQTDTVPRLAGGTTSVAPTVGTVGTSARDRPASTGFLGITGAAQAAANNAYDLEPPDQGLCSNGTDVVEMVNNAFAVYSTSGSPLTPVIAASSVFGAPDESTGYFTSDPHCYYDPSTDRWFLVELAIPGYFSGKGHSTKSYELLAVSTSGDPTGSYVGFEIPTADQSDNGCPCFGDYPMIGADANGVYVTTNEFPIYKAGFNGVQLYAMSKAGLVAAANGAAPPPVVHLGALSSPFPGETVGDTYHLSPALTPVGGSYDAANGGTEYFTMSDVFPSSASSLAVYALTNTASLDSATPQLSLNATVVPTQAYSYPANSGVAVSQEASSTLPPLAAYIKSATGSAPAPAVLQSDFDAVQETTYSGGNLYTALDTVTSSAYSSTYQTDVGSTAAEWFHITASDNGSLSAGVASQGAYAVKGQSLLYPDLVVNPSGQGDLVFTLTGPDNYPSAAFVSFAGDAVRGNTGIAAAGTGPEDGFTCYDYFVGAGYGGCRWGDYSGGVAVGSTVWMATEYVPPASTRDFYTNWGTYVFSTTAG